MENTYFGLSSTLIFPASTDQPLAPSHQGNKNPLISGFPRFPNFFQVCKKSYLFSPIVIDLSQGIVKF